MTKTLQEIQEENRRLILEVFFKNHWQKEDISDLMNYFCKTERPIYVNEMLFALQDKIDVMAFGLNYSHATFDSWWITSSGAAAGIIEMWICKWDLTKETLEEQSEETQRQINELLNNNHAKI